MTDDQQEPGPFQFSLRSLLVLMLICAFGLVILKWCAPNLHDFEKNLLLPAIIFLPVIVGVACWFVGRMANRSLNWFGHRQPFVTVCIVVLCLSTLATAYGCWARKRVTGGIIFGLQAPRALPYPDRTLCSLERWYDARYPASPDGIKIHGEWLLVILTINVLILPFLALAAFCGGLLTPRIWLYHMLHASWQRYLCELFYCSR